jgi:hypothetical protein
MHQGQYFGVFCVLSLRKLLLLTTIGGLIPAACSASMQDSGPSESERRQASKRGNAVNEPDRSIRERFGTLDQYLEHLELTQGPVDGPWYKRIGPDTYELQTGNLKLDGPAGADAKKVFTRQELARMFGFSD